MAKCNKDGWQVFDKGETRTYAEGQEIRDADLQAAKEAGVIAESKSLLPGKK